MQKLREDVMASGQVTKPMPSFAPAAFAMHRGQELIGAISRKENAKVWSILRDPAHADIKEQIATHCAYNDMTPLHHACRVMFPGWVKELMLWAPQVVNWPTYEGVTPSHWTPLQCMLDNCVTLLSSRDWCERMCHVLIGKMSEVGIQNATGLQEKGGGRQGGGLNVLHQLASRNSKMFVYTVCRIREVFGYDVVIGMLNRQQGDGRGVVDMALGSSVAMAMDLKQRFPGAVEQTTSQKLYEEQEKGQGCATAAPGDRRKRSRDWQEDWQEDWHQSDWSSHSGWKRRR